MERSAIRGPALQHIGLFLYFASLHAGYEQDKTPRIICAAFAFRTRF